MFSGLQHQDTVGFLLGVRAVVVCVLSFVFSYAGQICVMYCSWHVLGVCVVNWYGVWLPLLCDLLPLRMKR